MKQKILVDANIIVRYLTKDDPNQYVIANSVMQRKDLTAPETIISEVVYSLHGQYSYSRREIAFEVGRILSAIDIDDRGTIELAVEYYGETKLDYADCLLMAKHFRYGYEVATFDKELLKEIKKRES